MTLLDVKNLTVRNLSPYQQDEIIFKGLNFKPKANQITGLFGESGSGKSLLAQIIVGDQPSDVEISQGQLKCNALTSALMPQDPNHALNPYQRIEKQFKQIIENKTEKTKPISFSKLLSDLCFPNPKKILSAYPFQLSGGMKQRVLLALYLLLNPDLLILDDPFSGLDEETKEKIITFLKNYQHTNQSSILILSHNFKMLKKISDEIYFCENGQINKTNQKQTQQRYYRPKKSNAPQTETLIEIKKLSYATKRQKILKNISFSIHKSETLALIGKSGSGKTTIGRIIAGIIKPQTGKINTEHLTLEMIFQNPTFSLNPAHSIYQNLLKTAPFREKKKAREKIRYLLEKVKIDPRITHQKPAFFSDGEKQIFAILQSFLREPDLIILDEPTANLDPKSEKIILKLLRELQSETGTSFLFISHNLKLVESFADRIIQLQLGKIIDQH